MSNVYSDLLKTSGNVTNNRKRGNNKNGNNNAVGNLPSVNSGIKNNGNKNTNSSTNNGKNEPQGVMDSLLSQLSNVTGTIQNKTASAWSNVQNQVSNARNQVTHHVSKMSTTEKVVMVLASILLVCVIVYIIYLIFQQGKLIMATNEPIFFPSPGKDARELAIIPPEKIINSDDGTYSWSVWVRFYPRWFGKYRYNHWRSIFFKGSIESVTEPGALAPPEAPGLWVLPKSNNILFSVQTYALGKNDFVLKDIDVGGWVNLCVVVNKGSVDIYRNGKLESTHVLRSPPKQNNFPVHVNYQGGYGGRLAYLQYFPRALEPGEVDNIYNQYKSTVESITIPKKDIHPPCNNCKKEF